jgi:release factor glutamine methyltransferase
MTILEALTDGTRALRSVSGPDAGRDAALLLAFVAGHDRTFQIAHPEFELSEAETVALAGLFARRLQHEPIQYITGRQEFYGLEFEVTPDVLIPRPETEIVVEEALTSLKQREQPNILDIGTGSGCIIISILKNHGSSIGTGVDISAPALRVAARNAAKHAVSSRLSLIRSDMFDALGEERFDLILSNPPYVPLTDISTLQREVRDFEPHTALTDGGSGLSIIERIIGEAPAYIAPGGRLIVEIGFDQASKVDDMFDRGTWTDVRFIDDLQGIPRVFSAEIARADFSL